MVNHARWISKTSELLFDICYTIRKGLLGLIGAKSGITVKSEELVNTIPECTKAAFVMLLSCNFGSRRSYLDSNHTFLAGSVDRFRGVLVLGR